jgi:DNA-directed RNA polymerase subunit RPC12/RpoP
VDTNLRCTTCGRRFYSASYRMAVAQGERCPKCEGELEIALVFERTSSRAVVHTLAPLDADHPGNVDVP